VDIFPRSVAAPSAKDKIHDINLGIASNGLFWTTPIPDTAVHVSADGRSASLSLSDYPVQDQPLFGANTVPTYVGRISLNLAWTAMGSQLGITDPHNHYRLQFYRATVQATIRVTVPEIGFTFISDPASAQTIYAMIGHDQNGMFF